jgi:hypothetical protein
LLEHRAALYFYARQMPRNSAGGVKKSDFVSAFFHELALWYHRCGEFTQLDWLSEAGVKEARGSGRYAPM